MKPFSGCQPKRGRKSFAHALPALTAFVLLLGVAQPSAAQRRSAARGFQGEWNWAIYAESKDELPPAYRDMDVKEVPAYALDLTIRQRRGRLSGTFGLLARYLARVDEGSFDSRVAGRSVQLRLKSNFGGSATVLITLRGDQLHWKTLRSSGEMYFPKEVVLRRMKPGEKLPYVVYDGRDED